MPDLPCTTCPLNPAFCIGRAACAEAARYNVAPLQIGDLDEWFPRSPKKPRKPKPPEPGVYAGVERRWTR